ncbi:MAG TPA: helix-turn-helix transcriptional regulator [Gammaproteobacteria bacterium]|nr:helix-turn-helix transcriptional regulator [Gammaproteobacteria bacterium]
MRKLRKNHVFLSSGTSIAEICKPLQYLHTHMFTYMKNYHDGTQVYLSSDSNWVEDYFELKLYNSSYFEGIPSEYASGFKWWPGASDLPVYLHARDYYDSDCGITLCQQEKDGCEFFFFSSGIDNKAKMETYLNNLDLLENFALFFKESAGTILQKCNNSRVKRQGSNVVIVNDAYAVNRRAFLQCIGASHSAVEKFLKQFEKLTRRERECFNHIMTNANTQDTADKLGISVRTAETHISRILSKLQCSSKNELIIKLYTTAENYQKPT